MAPSVRQPLWLYRQVAGAALKGSFARMRAANTQVSEEKVRDQADSDLPGERTVPEAPT